MNRVLCISHLRFQAAGTARVAACVFLFSTALMVPGQTPGQTAAFGKNKIQYTPFEWKVLESRHIRLFFYTEEEHLARLALGDAEEAYSRVAARFAFEIPRKIPLILYASHQRFEETNVSPYFLPEGVAGFTEFAQGRVAIPFNGSYKQFSETLEHELVHAFQLARKDEIYRLHFGNRLARTPLWFTEGHADHWAEEWDATADFVMRDLVVHESLPDIRDLGRYNGTFTIYKIGQHLVGWLEETFGPRVVSRLYDEFWRTSDFHQALENVAGMSLESLNLKWKQSLKLRYFPEVETHEPLDLSAVPLAVQGGNFKAVGDPQDSTRVFYISSRTGYVSLYQAETERTDHEVKELLPGQRRDEFESLHPGDSRLAVSSRGHLAFVSKHQDRDALFLLDVETRRVLGEWKFEGLVALASPSFSPGGDEIVFAGLHESGRQDIYRLDLSEPVLEPLTRDLFLDDDPAWSADGETVVFVSDRGSPTGNTHLFRMHLDTKRIDQLTHGESSETSPAWSFEGNRLAYSSTQSGMPQITIMEFMNGQPAGTVQVTRILGACFDPAWLSEQTLAFTGYSEGKIGIYKTQVPAPVYESSSTPPEWIASLSPMPRFESASAFSVNPDSALESLELPYRPRFRLTFAQGAVAVEPTQNVAEGLQFLMSDQLGDRLLFFQVAASGASFSDVFGRFSLGATYWNVSRRMNRGLSLFHHASDFLDEAGFRYFERRIGGSLLASYPFSKYNRADVSVGLLHSDHEGDSFRDPRKAILITNYFSLVHDTSLWTLTGPIDGTRVNTTVGLQTNIEKVDLENLSLLVDARKYFRLGLNSAYALRVQARFAEGSYPQRFLLGGTWDLRLYPRRSLVGTRSVLVNQEVRFPFLHGLLIGAPFGNLGFPGIQGALFVDAAQVWNEDQPIGTPLGGFGAGLRLGLGGAAVLRLDLGKRTDFERIEPKTHVDFFFGFNY